MAERKRRDSRTKSRPLVTGFLEKVSSQIFIDYRGQVADLVGRQHGIYALYRGATLYYVGLATNLRSRIKQHLKDRHAGRWDRFSLYLVRKADHIKELESIVLRVSSPAGNRSKGRLARAANLRKGLAALLKSAQRTELRSLIGVRDTRRAVARGAGKKASVRSRPNPMLAPYKRRMGNTLRGSYKGATFTAKVRPSGMIVFSGRSYTSPSAAGAAVKGRRTNGWKIWHFKNRSGVWVKLEEIRRAR